MLQLAVGEFQARQAADTSPSIDEFTTRFSDISAELRIKLSELATGRNAQPQGHFTRTATFISDQTVGGGQVGRYRLERVLGEGAFGRVYLAYDEELQRQVAIKIPTPERFQKPEDAEQYLAEARTVASLNHPNIVPVYDTGRTADGSIYVVSKYIEGCTLDDRIKQDRPGHDVTAKLLAKVAQALHHAHQRRLIHRDVKPGNILLEGADSTPYVADFGLAIREEDYLKDRKLAGTPAYMSPEQARGEGHRLDGRSDIFSLGVVLYELLTGKRPFRGSTPNELLHQVVSLDPRPPRELDESIPAELERVCLKALSKRATDRYATAAELADDLLLWNQSPQRETKELPIVPKGLRSFDADDAEFFLDLLPGPRNRNGLPENIQFWKTRIEETDSDKTFSVGLIYGPSGCGKSSLVKAGLLPRLSKDVTAIYVEATPDETETRILRGLRKSLPELPQDLGLVETFSLLRRAEGKKVVVVLDQFEQWLHAHRAEQETKLVAALRQCDGGSLQAVVMVRDDFSMAATRFMRELETRIVEGHNFTTVDLFDVDHAQKVLVKFGQAFGKLPAQTGRMASDEQSFVQSVASGLAQDGKVVSVRLALFAEMVKGKPWVPATLEEVGGTAGIGVNFLEETFSSREANPEHRFHQQAAREVLKSLLPEVGSDIKGHMRSHKELLEASGYQDRPGEFHDLLRILDGKMRLMTPTDPEGFQTESGSDPGSKFYQLTHDYLVPSLREWLTRKQKESRRGRAELRLAERTALWNAKPENRHLPAWWEYLSIAGLTSRKQWTDPQRKMMRQAGRWHAIRLTVLAILLCTATVGGLSYRRHVIADQRMARAHGLVTALLSAQTAEVPSLLREMQPLWNEIGPLLSSLLPEHPETSRERLHLALCLAPEDPGQTDFLTQRLLAADPGEVDVIRSTLKPQQTTVAPKLWTALEAAGNGQPGHLLTAASGLALYEPESARWQAAADGVAESLVSENPLRAATWIELLRPARNRLVDPLGAIFRDSAGKYSETQRDLATGALEQYVQDDADTLSELILDSEPKQFLALFDELARHQNTAIARLRQELDRELTFSWHDPPLKDEWTQPPADYQQQIEAAHGLLAERFAFCQDMPGEDFSRVAEALRASGYRPIRVRPFVRSLPSLSSNPTPDVSNGNAGKNDFRVAAVWTRDDRHWELAPALTLEEIAAQDEQQRSQGRTVTDVAGYATTSDQQLVECFAVLWTERRSDEEESRPYAGATDNLQAYGDLEKQGFPFQHTLQGYRGADGRQKYCGVKSKATGSGSWSWDLAPADYESEEHLDKIPWDISLNRAPEILTTQLRYEAQLAAADKQLETKADDLAARLSRAEAHYYLDHQEAALADLTAVIDKAATTVSAFQLRALAHARLGKKEEASQDLSRFRELNSSDSTNIYLAALVAGYLGDAESGAKQLEVGIESHGDDNDYLYNMACAYSLLSAAAQTGNETASKLYQDRAVALLKQIVGRGYNSFAHMQTDPDLDALRSHAGFQEIMSRGRLDQRYQAVWQTSADYEGQAIGGVATSEHLQRCLPLIEKGYRPFGMTAFSSGDTDQFVTAAVWHRPLVPDAAREELAQRQANAAVALLRFDHADKVWPLLDHQSDPRLRSWIIHRLSPLGASASALAGRFRQETQVRIRQALLLSLGEFSSAAAIPDREALNEELQQLYREDPDPGLHASVGWLLRRWGEGARLADVDQSLASGAVEGGRQWYLTRQGQTMVVINGPEEFLMGSPGREAGRFGNESLHRQGLGRKYALASTETTVEQFQRFLRANPTVRHSYTRQYAPEAACPQTAVTWFEAAAYCRWLSEQEGIAEVQMCYPSVVEIKSGMQLPADYLRRTGYRLPTEAEWEYACRAGSGTSRYFGQGESLLGQYAWYQQTSQNRSWPIGMLKPNELGLFDMLGNVYEWCQESYVSYPAAIRGQVRPDTEVRSAVDDRVSRVVRGGSFSNIAPNLRCANRNNNQPDYRYNNAGFRVARTYP